MSKARLSVVLATAAILVASVGGALAQIAPPDQPEPLAPIDVSGDIASARLGEALVSNAQREAARSLQDRVGTLEIRWNPLTGTPRRVQSRESLLTEAAPGVAPDAVMRGFLQENATMFGLAPGDLNTLVPVRQAAAMGTPEIAPMQRAGLDHVALEQRWQGRQIFPATVVGSVTSRGELVSLAGEVVRDVGAKINALEPDLSPLDAIGAAARSIGASFDPTAHPPLDEPEGAERRQMFSAGDALDADVPVRLIYFVASPDEVRLVWEVTAGVRRDPFAYQVLVDSLTGDVLFRETITDQDTPRWLAYFRVDVSPPVDPRNDFQALDNLAPESPGPATPDGSQGTVVPPVLFQTDGEPSVSPGGWIPPGTMTTTGNNVIAFVDRDFDSSPDPGEQPTATLEDVGGVQTRTFNFAADLAAEPDTAANEAAATVNTFAVANWWHDRMEQLGFNEAAGNFQEDNAGAGGVDGDPMLARLHVGTDNSTFSTPAADGTCCPRLNAYTWTGPNPDRDSGFDHEVLIHEFTHGLSNRIIGGPNVNGLGGAGQPRGLGEGYSDIYAYLLLRTADEDPDGTYVVGGYVTFHLNPAFGQPPDWADNYYFGIRHFPYTTDLCKNPFTLLDMQPATYDITPIPGAGCSGTPPVSPWLATRSGAAHDMGEIWAVMVWEVRRNLVAKHGAAAGNELTLQLVTDSLFLLARDPTFTEARDAILLADLARTGGDNRCEIWRGFAKRGFGLGAATPTTGTFTEDFAFPEDCEERVASAYSYAAKLVCGVQEDREDLRLTVGRYATTINIHNPGPEPARFTKTLALTFPPREQAPGEVTPIAEDTLDAEHALAADCADIRERLYPNGWPAPYVEGFVLIRSATSLDVVAVYTKSALEPEAGGVSIDVEAVRERKLGAEEPDDLADLIPEPDANGQFCRLRDGRLIVTARNQGAGAAGASTLRVDFGAHGPASAPTPALPAGAGHDHLVPLPGGCFDPDCGFRITVDHGDVVGESNEANNDASGVCIG
jgi:hypothetical protein